MTAIFLCCKLECSDCSSQLVLRIVKQLSENTSQIARRLHVTILCHNTRNVTTVLSTFFADRG